jgi:CheY-like chemotaxis protein
MANILLIENDARIQKIFKSVLKAHKITAVATGLAALEQLEEGKFDIVISDYDLDGPLSGEDVWLWVKNNRPDMTERYMFCSGNDKVETLCSDAGIPCLLKPASLDQIRQAVKLFLERDQ